MMHLINSASGSEEENFGATTAIRPGVHRAQRTTQRGRNGAHRATNSLENQQEHPKSARSRSAPKPSSRRRKSDPSRCGHGIVTIAIQLRGGAPSSPCTPRSRVGDGTHRGGRGKEDLALARREPFELCNKPLISASPLLGKSVLAGFGDRHDHLSAVFRMWAAVNQPLTGQTRDDSSHRGRPHPLAIRKCTEHHRTVQTKRTKCRQLCRTEG